MLLISLHLDDSGPIILNLMGMTMGRMSVTGLECDGCGVRLSPDPFIYRKSVTTTEEGLRMTAKLDMGWAYVNGEDRCPECQSPGVAR